MAAKNRYVWAIWCKQMISQPGRIGEIWSSRKLAINRMHELMMLMPGFHWSVHEHRILTAADCRETQKQQLTQKG